MMPLPGGHPLDVAGAEAAAIAEAVAVLDGTREHVGDRLDAAMRMPRKPARYPLIKNQIIKKP